MSGGDKETRVSQSLQHSPTWTNAAHTNQEILVSARPSPAPRKDCVAARPLALAGSLTQTSAGEACADQAGGKGKTTAAIHDYVEVVLESQLSRLPQPYQPDPHMTSLVSFPQRCNLWGDPRFHGNCDGTLFKELVLRYEPKSVADPMMGSGTTRDVIAGLNGHRDLDIRYWGSDLTKGFNATSQRLPGTFDFVWVHPPYWNIVRYGNSPADLSGCVTYEEFRTGLRATLRNCFEAVKPGGRLAILVADVRRRGRYFPIVRDLLNWEGELGELRSIIIKAQHNVRSDAKKYPPMEDVRIQHEYCVVFRKAITTPSGHPHVIRATNEEGNP